jgi:RNA polymerase sigma factor (TIGR02999 family)
MRREEVLRMGSANHGTAPESVFASQIMRRILVDHARTRGAQKRGGDARQVAPDTDLDIAIEGTDGLVLLLDLDRAIEALARENPEPARVIEMRYFGGMTAEETSAAVGRSVHIVRHELRFGHAWLRRRLAGKSR